MSLSQTRLGANAPGLPGPGPLPPISAALSRRAALFGAVTVASVTAASTAFAVNVFRGLDLPTAAQSTGLSANDAHLVALADAYEALDRRCAEHTAAHRHLTGKAIAAADDAFDALTSGYGPLEQECADTPADSFAGVMAKARLCQSPTARGCADFEHIASVADDLWRLFGAGVLS